MKLVINDPDVLGVFKRLDQTTWTAKVISCGVQKIKLTGLGNCIIELPIMTEQRIEPGETIAFGADGVLTGEPKLVPLAPAVKTGGTTPSRASLGRAEESRFY